MTEDTRLTYVKGVGPELAKRFATLGITTISQLIDHYPRRYDDYSHVQPISHIKPGIVTIKGQIKQAKGSYARRGLHITEAAASDETGSVRLVWFNQPYRAAALKPDADYYISGDFGLRRQRLSILNPSAELVSDFPVNTARIVPVYRETKGLKSLQIRRVLKEVLPLIRAYGETLPEWIIQSQKLIPRAEALEMMHFPASPDALEHARRRLGFEEVFRLTLAALLNKHELLQEKAVSIPFDEVLAKEFVSHLPFTLTDAQRRAVWQIYLDLQKSQPMNRLLEGDVGSGKTVVATMAAVMAMKQGFQVALMAPTEILARQHAETIYDLLAPLGMADQLSLLVGGLKSAQKSAAHVRIKSGEIGLIVGTHALIQEKVDMHKLGLVIVDEQHRFGVDQRKVLQKKAGHMPHVLNMTATPIPRSLALTLYGEMEITVIDTKPAGRKPILTKICSPNSRKQLYEKLDQQLEAGRQMFVVTPLVRESEMLPAKSAEETYKELTQKAFKHRRAGLLHGKMKPADKDRVMQQFVRHELDILVSTTVIEVGVNVPNATVMLIENADRFGLAQIHQLRGRVGRSEHQGYCFLMLSDSSAPSQRLRALEQTTDGFKLAELDLEIRGPGAIYGSQQHGQLDLRVAKLTDTRLIAAARKAAQEFIDRGENLLEYKGLQKHVQGLRAVTNLN
ncbi:MAG TPA: ATP-dependent DNA helicase RecG [Candidatus Limnocylindria bacterium]|nr:ATP-dependent DNA helicase RecG [Candidatus Limnocylindria bacterium]